MSAPAAPVPAPRVAEDDCLPFETARPHLLGIAHRVLGSASDAEDVVQDAWLRWHGTDRQRVRDPAGFLTTTTTRLALNVIHSARVRHETSMDPQRAEEEIQIAADPAHAAERQAALELAAGTLLQKLSAAECAVYVLREAFAYPYRDIARVLSIGEANARQLLVRGRRRLAGNGCHPVDAAEHKRLVDAVLAAARTGELRVLEDVLVTAIGAARHGSHAWPVVAAGP